MLNCGSKTLVLISNSKKYWIQVTSKLDSQTENGLCRALCSKLITSHAIWI